MILVDSSVWIDHFRVGNPKLRKLLHEQRVVTHPFVIGELACGNFRNRARILADLTALPTAVLAEHDEILCFIDDRKLWGKGIGWIDGHLLGSAVLSGCGFWTLDKALSRVASLLGFA